MDKPIFEVEISNGSPKGYETATVMKMPATWSEFNDALQKARITDGRFCKNELTCIRYGGLRRGIIGDNVNLYDLNLFAQRLATLTEDQQPGNGNPPEDRTGTAQRAHPPGAAHQPDLQY